MIYAAVDLGTNAFRLLIVDKDKAFIAGDMSGLSNETFYEGKKNNE